MGISLLILEFLKKNKPVILLNSIAIIGYFIVFSLSNYELNEESLFFAPDSQQYLNTSGEFYDFSQTGNSLTRPFLFPLLINIFYKTGGVLLFWLFQFFCWLATVNLIFLAVKKVTTTFFAWVAVSIIISNVSLIILTQLALTEVFSACLISFLIFILFTKNLSEIKTSYTLLFILVLLTVTRPVFYYLFLIYLLYHLFKYIVKSFQLKYILITLFLISPVIYQVTLMKVKYDKFKVSDIDSVTLRDYLVAQMIKEEKPDITRDESVFEARKVENTTDYILSDFKLAFKLILRNIDESLTGWPSLLHTKKFENPMLAKYMEVVNGLYYWLHIIFIFPLIYFLSIKWKTQDEKLPGYLFLFLMMSYVLLTSGISFMQGDRLIITLLPIWIVLYGSACNYFLNLVKSKI